jgi:hypothetical protein
MELIGLPAFILLCLGLGYSLFYIYSSRENRADRKVLITLWITFLVYFLYIGSFPRLETRFVLPIVPVGLIIAGSAISKIKPYKKAWLPFLIIILMYNFVSSYYVDVRFINDPRMEAQSWVMNTVPNGSSIESSGYTPEWNRLEGVAVQDVRMPFISARRKLFEETLGEDPWVIKNIDVVEVESEDLIAWYSVEALSNRNPDYIAINSLYYNRYLNNPSYPEIGEFFSLLLDEKTAYYIIFEKSTDPIPKWVYPQIIDTLANTMVVLEKSK